MCGVKPHRNIVLLLGICTTEGQFCIVTEFCDNGSLEK